jgi:selenocysteine lyase/cysteine desulfurase
MNKTISSGKFSEQSPIDNSSLLKTDEAFKELERGVFTALETYSNVHRGSGHKSLASTYLYEQTRDIVVDYLGLNKDKYTVIFCSPLKASSLIAQLQTRNYHCLSSQEFGLPIGVRALVVDKKALPAGAPSQSGGGTTRLVSPGWVIWAHAPDRFEAGTPAIINVIVFAKALKLTAIYGKNIFRIPSVNELSADEILCRDELEALSGQALLKELRKTIIGHGISVPTIYGSLPYINLDNAASTPTFVPVWQTVCQIWRQPKLVHQEIISTVRAVCAELLGALPEIYDVIFTSNTTEAINLVAESLSHISEQDFEPVVINTLLEHNSNDLPWRMQHSLSHIRLKVDDDGFLDLNELETLLSSYNQKSQFGKKRIRLLAISGASNVLGVFNHLVEISRIVHQYGAHLLVDAAQMIAHRKVDIEKCGIDYLAFSAHKVYAPFGTGILVARKGLLNFTPDKVGQIKSSGEENVVGIAALGKALLLLQRIGLDLIRDEEQNLTRLALHKLSQIGGLRVYGIKDPNFPEFDNKGGVIVFSIKNIMPDRVAKELAVRGGIGIRYGCHCAHLLVKNILHVPPFLEKFQGLLLKIFPGINLPGIARVSLGIENSKEDIDKLIQVLTSISRQEKLRETKHFDSFDGRMNVFSMAEVQKQINDFTRSVAQRVYESG